MVWVFSLTVINSQYSIEKVEHRGHKINNAVAGINFEIRAKGPLYNRLNHMENIDIDISLRNDIIFTPDIKYLMPAYIDIPVFPVPIMNINEISIEKAISIIERDKMRDIYDLYFLFKFRKIKADMAVINRKMELRHEVFNKNEFLLKLDAALELRKWASELSYLIRPSPDNKEVVKFLHDQF